MKHDLPGSLLGLEQTNASEEEPAGKVGEHKAKKGKGRGCRSSIIRPSDRWYRAQGGANSPGGSLSDRGGCRNHQILGGTLPQIHQIISSVMPAENFYITLYDEVQNLLRFSYFKDAEDEPFMGGIQPGKGLTAYVLRTGKSLLCTQAVHDELERQGEVKLLGVPSAIWLGVPLMVEGKTIGAMVVQHYTDPNAYGEREQHMLEFVSTQVAIAINRKRSEEKLEEERILLRTLIDNLPDRIYVMDVKAGKSFRTLQTGRRPGEKAMEDVIGKTDLEIYPPELANGLLGT